MFSELTITGQNNKSTKNLDKIILNHIYMCNNINIEFSLFSGNFFLTTKAHFPIKIH